MAQTQWLYGMHALEALLEREPERLIELFVLKGRDDQRLMNIVNQARRFGVSVQFCQRRTLDDKVEGAQHQAWWPGPNRPGCWMKAIWMPLLLPIIPLFCWFLMV